MKEQLISFETAKLAKEKRFDWKCEMCFLYEENEPQPFKNPAPSISNKIEMVYSAPTQSLLQKWLREVHGIHVTSISQYNTNRQFQYYYVTVNGKAVDELEFNTYEEALEKGLFEALI